MDKEGKKTERSNTREQSEFGEAADNVMKVMSNYLKPVAKKTIDQRSVQD